MGKFEYCVTSFLIGMIIASAFLCIYYLPNQSSKNKYSDSHLICSYSKTNSNVLICKINGANK